MQLLPQAVRELGETTAEFARKLGITQPAVSLSVRRGEKLVKEMGLEMTWSQMLTSRLTTVPPVLFPGLPLSGGEVGIVQVLGHHALGSIK
jgi:hypothetical protein